MGTGWLELQEMGWIRVGWVLSWLVGGSGRGGGKEDSSGVGGVNVWR
jgi:hypothetical protein